MRYSIFFLISLNTVQFTFETQVGQGTSNNDIDYVEPN